MSDRVRIGIICDRCRTCAGCPGGSIEYAPEEMKKNGATVVHLATGPVAGYSPCPHLDHFRRLIPARFGIAAVVRTHPIPQRCLVTRGRLGTWTGPEWPDLIALPLADASTGLAYD